jgi:hypothetical protein
VRATTRFAVVDSRENAIKLSKDYFRRLCRMIKLGGIISFQVDQTDDVTQIRENEISIATMETWLGMLRDG